MTESSSGPDLSVVLPAHNEEAALDDLLSRLKKVLADRAYEILLVDDGSEDRTAEIGEKHGVRVLRHARCMGNGAAVKRGIREAAGKEGETVELDGSAPSLGDLLDLLVERGGGLGEGISGKPVLCAVNIDYSGREALLEEGDEVAIFPPVSGG